SAGEAGLLTSSWSTETGRRRRTYSISAKGRRAMRDRRQGWDEFSGAVARVLEGAPWPATN
ncbi:MAG: PadR family transcriptional regulator, partial [Acidimicrobiia bacterium]|nr:PadR family transcriptional regulator [Acidimicrobiia bacterium]